MRSGVSANCETVHADAVGGDGAERRRDEWAVAWIDWDADGERVGKVDDRT